MTKPYLDLAELAPTVSFSPSELNDLRKDLSRQRKAEIALRQRVKELTCLTEISQILEDDVTLPQDLYQQVAEQLVKATQFPDLAHPFYGKDELAGDVWVGYRRRIFRTIDWRLQLNVRNAWGTRHDIPVTANPDGSILHLGDVARVELGAANEDSESRLDGNPAISMAIYLAPGANAVDTSAAVRAARPATSIRSRAEPMRSPTSRPATDGSPTSRSKSRHLRCEPCRPATPVRDPSRC